MHLCSVLHFLFCCKQNRRNSLADNSTKLPVNSPFANTAPTIKNLNTAKARMRQPSLKANLTQPAFNLTHTREEIKTNSFIYLCICSYSEIKISRASQMLIMIFCLNYWIYL